MVPSPPNFKANEAARIAALRTFGVLDTEPEPQFDDIVRLARTICGTAVALVSLVDIEPAELGGWQIKFQCNRATVTFLQGISDRSSDERNPLWMIA